MSVSASRRLAGPSALRVFYCLVAAFAANSLIVLLSSMNWPLSHDAPHMHYIAREIHRGAVPYRDLWDMNWPGVYLVHWILVALPGDIDFVWRAFDLCLLAGLCGMMYALARQNGRYIAYFAPVAMLNWYLVTGPTNTGQRDHVVAFFELFAVSCLILGNSDGKQDGRWRCLAAGISFGLATTIKPFAALMFGLCMLVYLHHTMLQDTQRRFVQSAIALLAGFASGLAVVGTWLLAHGGGPYFLATLLQFTLPVYSKMGNIQNGLTDQVMMLMRLIMESRIFNLLLFVLLAPLAAWSTRSVPLSLRTKVLLMAVVGGLGHFVFQWKFWSYHWSPFYVFAFVLATDYLATILAQPDKRLAWFAPGMVLATCMFTVPIYIYTMSDNIKHRFHYEPIEREFPQDLCRYFKEHVAPDATVQYMGCVESGTMNAIVRSNLRQSTPLLYDFWVLFADPGVPFVQEVRREFIERLRRDAPALVIVDRLSWPKGGYDRLDLAPEFKVWLDERYEVDLTTNDYKIYRRK